MDPALIIILSLIWIAFCVFIAITDHFDGAYCGRGPMFTVEQYREIKYSCLFAGIIAVTGIWAAHHRG